MGEERRREKESGNPFRNISHSGELRACDVPTSYKLQKQKFIQITVSLIAKPYVFIIGYKYLSQKRCLLYISAKG
jgi:hypothetical protein